MTWPTFAHVFADEIEIASAETVQRTQLEDGRVRQRLAWPGAPVRRTVRAYVRSDAERETFAAWAARAHAPFAAPAGITGAAAQVVVVGGAGGIRYRSVVMPGPRWEWEIELVLEDAD